MQCLLNFMNKNFCVMIDIIIAITIGFVTGIIYGCNINKL